MVALVAVDFRCGELPKAVTVACPLSWELSLTKGLGERSMELRALRRGLARSVGEGISWHLGDPGVSSQKYAKGQFEGSK